MINLRGDALVLEFLQGLASRPVLYPAPSGSTPLDGGTRIEIKLSKDPRSEGGILRQEVGDYYSRAAYSLADLLWYLAPASDVTIHAVENGNAVVAVSAGDWLVMPAEELAARLVGPGFSHWEKIQIKALRLMRNIRSGDHVYGRATISPEYLRHGCTAALIVGGLRIEPLGELAGVIEGNVNRLDRRSGFISADEAALAEWATEQANLIEAMLSDQDKASCVEVILKLGGDIGELPVAFWQGHWLSTSALKQVVEELNEIKIDEVAPAYYSDEPCSMDEYYRWEKVGKDTLLIWDKQTRLYQRHWDDPEHKPLLPYVMNIIRQAWGDLVEVDRHRGHFKRR